MDELQRNKLDLIRSLDQSSLDRYTDRDPVERLSAAIEELATPGVRALKPTPGPTTT